MTTSPATTPETKRRAREAARRRTFAIISHPDAGKTTLTEKLLLYANAIHLAGSVKARRAARHAISDWMRIEQERGISVTSSVLQFDYLGRALNLLDTPGHADFSEDTFRTLAAVDSALMLIDHAKGIEDRTRRLFEVCRRRGLPVVTFMNKLDREGRHPLELVDEIRERLGLAVAPVNWPLGMGRDFRGVVDVARRTVTLYEPSGHGESVVAARTLEWEAAREELPAALVDRVAEELALLEAAGDPDDEESERAGALTPVFWGSAMTNVGIEPLLRHLVERGAPPGPRTTEDGRIVAPTDERFTGFVFKIQANMNPRHRDAIAFVRVASGRFRRGMDVVVGRTGETMRLAKPHSFLANERSIVEEAWPGDIVGVYDNGRLRVGDTLAEGARLRYDGIPRFAPEHFGRLRLEDPLRRKALDTGLEQLAHEGVIQLFFAPGQGRQSPVLGAVGLLQFEVLKARLRNEYGVRARFEKAPYRAARWVGGRAEGLDWLRRGRGYAVMEDRNGRPVVLADSEWSLTYALENAPGLELFDVEPV